jgi:hypothetical protein
MELHLAKGINWCISAIIEFLFSINVKILTSFFSHIWKILSYDGISTYIDQEFAKAKCRREFVILKLVLIVTLIITIAFF